MSYSHFTLDFNHFTYNMSIFEYRHIHIYIDIYYNMSIVEIWLILAGGQKVPAPGRAWTGGPVTFIIMFQLVISQGNFRERN